MSCSTASLTRIAITEALSDSEWRVSDEVKREEELFNRVPKAAEQAGREGDVDVRTELVPGHHAEVITHYAAASPSWEPKERTRQQSRPPMWSCGPSATFSGCSPVRRHATVRP